MDEPTATQRDLARRVVLERIRATSGTADEEAVDAPDVTPSMQASGAEQASDDDSSSGTVDDMCEGDGGPIRAWRQIAIDGAIQYRFTTIGFEDDWTWWIDGEFVSAEPTAAYQFSTPGRHTVSLKRAIDRGSSTGYEDQASGEVCVEPELRVQEVDETATEFLDYLAEEGYPPDAGAKRWFTADASVLGDDTELEWSIEAADGGDYARTQIYAPEELSTPIRFYRPGEFTLSLTAETEEGLTAEWSDTISVTADPVIQVKEYEEQYDGPDEIAVEAHHDPFLYRSDTDFVWYLDDQDEPAGTGPETTIEVSTVNLSLRVELEGPGGPVGEARAPIAGATPSRWSNGATIRTSTDAIRSTVDGGTDLDASSDLSDDVIVLEEPTVVRFTAGEMDDPPWLQGQYRWSVKYSERFRDGVDRNADPDPDSAWRQDDLVSEYDWDDTEYELFQPSKLVYPFAEPGWYVVELEQTGTPQSVELPPESTGSGEPGRYDYTTVYVKGMEDPGRAWPDTINY